MKALFAVTALLLCCGINCGAQACPPSLQCPHTNKMLKMGGGSHDLTAALGASKADMVRAADMCGFCHTRHDRVPEKERLWGQGDRPRLGTFTAPTLLPTDAPLDSLTARCISCHDGTVASSAGNNPSVKGETTVVPQSSDNPTVADVTVKLQEPNDRLGTRPAHPVNFAFRKESAGRYDLRAPASESSVDGYGVVPLYSSRMECTTCHDPHQKGDAMPRLFPTGAKYDNATGNFCLYCHL